MKLIEEWYQHGGVLCCSSGIYHGTVKPPKNGEKEKMSSRMLINQALVDPGTFCCVF
jgi:hypothetical protein